MLDPVRRSCPITGHGPIAGQSDHEPTTQGHVYPVFNTTTTIVVVQYTRSERAQNNRKKKRSQSTGSWSSVSSLAIEVPSVTAKTNSKTHIGTHTDSGVDQRIMTSRLHCKNHTSLSGNQSFPVLNLKFISLTNANSIGCFKVFNQHCVLDRVKQAPQTVILVCFLTPPLFLFFFVFHELISEGDVHWPSQVLRALNLNHSFFFLLCGYYNF